MSFRIEGGGGDGSGVRVWEFKTSNIFDNTAPNSGKYIELWDRNDPLKPEPSTAYIFVAGQVGWMNKAHDVPLSETAQYPPSCGAAFGFKKYLKGQIPEKVYAWRGRHQESYPYTYAWDRFFGFNTEPSLTNAMEIPNPGGQSMFHQADFIPADAVNNSKGAWDKIFNGGKGHWFDRSTGPENFVGNDGCGSSASIFGPGHDGGHYPAGSGGPGTDTARGPVAKGLAEGILTEMGLFRNFIWGQAQTDSDWGDGGEYEVHIPPGLFMFGQGPIDFNLTSLQLPNANKVPGRFADMRGKQRIIFSVMLEYR